MAEYRNLVTTAETLAVIDAAHLRLMLDPTNDADCELAGELLYARVNVAILAERLDDSVSKAESREAGGFAAFFAGCVGGCVGLLVGSGGPEFLARLFG